MVQMYFSGSESIRQAKASPASPIYFSNLFKTSVIILEAWFMLGGDAPVCLFISSHLSLGADLGPLQGLGELRSPLCLSLAVICWR